MKRTLEIRSYNLRPGTRPQFHAVVQSTVLPMLRRWGMDVVVCGPSRHDEDSYFIMRSYENLADRQARQDAFYGSEEWKAGPRDAIIAQITGYTSIVIEVDAPTLAGLRPVG